MKIKVFKTILIFVLICAVLAGCMKTGIVYPAGPDTFRLYGDGSLQIVREFGIRSLFFIKYNSLLVPEINRIKETSEKVYIIGYDRDKFDLKTGGFVDARYQIYAVIDVNDNSVSMCVIRTGTPALYEYREYIIGLDEMELNGDMVFTTDFSDFPEEDQRVFEKMGAGCLGRLHEFRYRISCWARHLQTVW